MQTNLLLDFYPSQIKTHIVKRRHHDTEKVFRGIEAPKTKEDRARALEQMKHLVEFQSGAMSMLETKTKSRSDMVKSRLSTAVANLNELDLDLHNPDLDIGKVLNRA